MGQHFENLKKALENTANFAAQAVLNILQTPNVVREGIGNVLLAGISTSAAAVAAARVQFAVQVARRRPFASPQSVCAAARDAANEADDYAPYLITVEAFFGDPLAMIALGGFAGVPGNDKDKGAEAKAMALLALLVELPPLDKLDQLLEIFNTHVVELEKLAKQMYHDVGKPTPPHDANFDPSAFLRGTPLNQAALDNLENLVKALNGFGVNAPTMLPGLKAGVPKVFHAAVRGTKRITDAVYAQYDALCGVGVQPARSFYERRERTISLDRTYPSIPAGDGSWALLVSGNDTDLFAVGATDEQSRSEFGLSGKTTELTLEAAKKKELDSVFKTKVRELSVFAESEEVGIAEKPDDSVVEGDRILLEQLTDGLLADHPIAVSGRHKDTKERVTEVTFLRSPNTVVENRTQLALRKPLAYRYLRDTVHLNANLAPTSHGESIRETLGSGDASARHQEFALKQAPLTYVHAGTASGRAPTLAVFVNDMRWAEVPTLVGREPHERVFVTEADDEGHTRVRFGNGAEGAVAASGFNNLRAEYRKGVGEPGNVRAGTLTTLLTRPVGVASVVNPVTAADGEDIEQIDETRSKAPMTVRTFERAVSLSDYEDFALTYPGIAKALATWTPAGAARGILLTVAGHHGAAVDDTSKARRGLFEALRKYGDPLIPFEIKTYVPAIFHVKATVTVGADSTKDVVMAGVNAALLRNFGFDARLFADAISVDDVMASIHTVSGVVAADVDELYRDGQPAQLNATLVALPPQLQSDGSATAAELLCLGEATVDLTSVQLNGMA